MIWLQLFIPVVVICSKLIETEAGQSRDCHHMVSGVAKINYYKEGFICSGVHLKPWIVLTFGDCLFKREVDRFSVTVNIYPGNEKEVEVKSVEFDPEYEYQKTQRNLALLYIYGQIEWCVGLFSLPSHVFTKEVILSGRYYTFIYRWIMYSNGELQAESTFIKATGEYKECGTEEITDWYCVQKEGLAKYRNNKGMPFYFSWKGHRGLLGLHTGVMMSKDAKGSLFQAVLPSYIWINEFIHEHPAPNP